MTNKKSHINMFIRTKMRRFHKRNKDEEFISGLYYRNPSNLLVEKNNNITQV